MTSTAVARRAAPAFTSRFTSQRSTIAPSVARRSNDASVRHRRPLSSSSTPPPPPNSSPNNHPPPTPHPLTQKLRGARSTLGIPSHIKAMVGGIIVFNTSLWFYFQWDEAPTNSREFWESREKRHRESAEASMMKNVKRLLVGPDKNA